MDGDDLIFGYGPAGKAIATRLAAAGRPVRIAQRSRPGLPPGMTFVPCDVLDLPQVMAAAKGAARIIIAIGFPYDAKVWASCWPRAIANLLTAAEVTGAPTLFFDNMYMYGPQDGPIRETSPFAPWGGKPAVRCSISAMWQEAAAAGKVRMSALRVSDFFGPGVSNSHLGDTLFGRLAKGKPALFVVPVDQPHDVAYLPDAARAVETLLDAPEDAWGQVWHMPCPKTRTFREIVAIAAKAMGQRPRIQTIPTALQPVLRLAMPMLREVHDMRFLFDRPYKIDASKFTSRFWSDVTPIEMAVAETARAFRDAALHAQGRAGRMSAPPAHWNI